MYKTKNLIFNTLILFVCLTIIGCKKKEDNPYEDKVNNYKKFEAILDENISLYDKYDKIFNKNFDLFNYGLTEYKKDEIAKKFIDHSIYIGNVRKRNNGNLYINVGGSIDSKFKNKVLDDYLVWVTVIIEFDNKSFTTKQGFDKPDRYFEGKPIFEMDIDLINEFQSVFGNDKPVTLDESYLKYKPKRCVYQLEIYASNKIGDEVRIFYGEQDFMDFWEGKYPFR